MPPHSSHHLQQRIKPIHTTRYLCLSVPCRVILVLLVVDDGDMHDEVDVVTAAAVVVGDDDYEVRALLSSS